jgi:hypothetical protein
MQVCTLRSRYIETKDKVFGLSEPLLSNPVQIRTPTKRWQYVLFVNLLWFSIIPIAIFYYSRLSNEGAFPPEADSIGIPIIETAITVFVVAPFLNAFLWFASRQYPGSISIFYSGGSRRSRYWICTSLATLGVGLSIFACADSAFHADWEWAIASLPWLYVFAATRAIALQPAIPSPSNAVVRSA